MPVGLVRDGAWVADVTSLLELSSWPVGMRGDRAQGTPAPPRAAADHRCRRAPGHRVRDQHLPRPARRPRTASSAPGALRGPHPRRERHRTVEPAAARLAQNQIWCAIVALAVELTAWLQTLALAGHDARRWEPKRLRLRLFSIAARLADHGRTRRLHLSAHAPWAELLAEMITRLQTLPAPG
jgi:hypothetical protein